MTDRGPSAAGRKIDLSKDAAKDIGLTKKEGVAAVKIVVTKPPVKERPRRRSPAVSTAIIVPGSQSRGRILDFQSETATVELDGAIHIVDIDADFEFHDGGL